MNFKRKNDNISLDQLVGKLQKEDLKYSNLCKALKLGYWILIPTYTIMCTIIYIESKEINDLFAGLLFIGSFLIFALVLGNFQKEFNTVDYSLPTLRMLKSAANRYRPIRAKSLWAFAAFFMMGGGFYFSSLFNEYAVRFQSYFIALFFASLIISTIIWYFKYKPLRDNALRLIAEIEGE